MGICAEEIRRYVIAPCLQHLDDWSHSAENLLVGTAAAESGLGQHLLYQDHPGLGIYGITPATHTDIWDDYLAWLPDLASSVRGLASQREFLKHPHEELTTNLSYATAIAWMIYKRSGNALPDAEDIAGLSALWRQCFQKNQKNPQQHFISEYQRCHDCSTAAA